MNPKNTPVTRSRSPGYLPVRTRIAITKRKNTIPRVIPIPTPLITRRKNRHLLPGMMPIPIPTAMNCRPTQTPRDPSNHPRR